MSIYRVKIKKNKQKSLKNIRNVKNESYVNKKEFDVRNRIKYGIVSRET